MKKTIAIRLATLPHTAIVRRRTSNGRKRKHMTRIGVAIKDLEAVWWNRIHPVKLMKLLLDTIKI